MGFLIFNCSLPLSSHTLNYYFYYIVIIYIPSPIKPFFSKKKITQSIIFHFEKHFNTLNTHYQLYTKNFLPRKNLDTPTSIKNFPNQSFFFFAANFQRAKLNFSGKVLKITLLDKEIQHAGYDIILQCTEYTTGRDEWSSRRPVVFDASTCAKNILKILKRQNFSIFFRVFCLYQILKVEQKV